MLMKSKALIMGISGLILLNVMVPRESAALVTTVQRSCDCDPSFSQPIYRIERWGDGNGDLVELTCTLYVCTQGCASNSSNTDLYGSYKPDRNTTKTITYRSECPSLGINMRENIPGLVR